MKKQVLSILALLLFYSASAQYDYTPTGRRDVPVLGMQWGLTGGGFTSMLNNRDDIEADQRLDPQFMNFKYAAGAEFIYWFQNTVGFGAQLLYWKGGASYLGEDTISKLSLKATSDLTYLKLPFLFHFKSYNRYYPDRRTRFSAFFGPYVAVMQSYKDKVRRYNDEYKIDINDTYSGTKVDYNGTGSATLSAALYNPFDLGFVVGAGAEVRLWRRTTIALNLRADIGISNVENTRGMTIKLPGVDTVQNYSFWNESYAKYNSVNPSIDQNFEPNRPATKNFSIGAFLSIRKYLGQ
ncbi:MAG: PorT family protein [Chitinophagaceae bacterium]|nr:PorT family protein [Chitinophagaceae bacterium]